MPAACVWVDCPSERSVWLIVDQLFVVDRELTALVFIVVHRISQAERRANLGHVGGARHVTGSWLRFGLRGG